MEDYILIGSVLQATHMSGFMRRPKHLKRYELKTTRDQPPKPTIDMQAWERNSHKNSKVTAFGHSRSDSNDKREKIKTRVILEGKEKIAEPRGSDKVDQFVSEFFLKKLIEPKMCKQSTPRTATLLRAHNSQGSLFYDVNFEHVEKRQRNCIITPDSSTRTKFTKVKSDEQSENVNPAAARPSMSIREIVRNEWDEQQKKKKIQSKLGVHAARKKAYLHKKNKETETEGRSRDYQEVFLNGYVGCGPERDFHKEGSRTTRPMSQQEIKVQAVGIMHKYGIDSSKYYFKYFAS